MFRTLIASVLMVVGLQNVAAVTLADISNQDAVAGLREALVQGSGQAIGLLGRTDGFLGNPKVKIPLPQSLQRIEGTMRMFGLGRQADELVTTMNRAAESAVPEAKTLLIDAIRKMSISDAKGILAGSQDAATQYFKRTTSSALTERFLPIVKQATSKVQLTEMYNNYAGKAATFGLLDAADANLDQYITQRALDGLFTMIADEEKAIRANPMGSATNIVKRVFGAIGR
jgi:Protein of unknown function (DUF4197)